MVFLTSTAETVRLVRDQALDQEPWIDGVEVRADLLRADERPGILELPSLLRGRGLRLICTARLPADGGRWTQPEHERLDLLVRAARAGYDYIDLEANPPDAAGADHVASVARAAGATVIRSMHDLTGVPADLSGLLRALPREASDVAKCAVTPRSTLDLAAVVRAADGCEGSHVVLGMGEYGFPTRVLPRRLGNLLTFASPPDGAAAPGQVSARILDELYRVRSHGPSTRCFAVIGNPIGHSRSPDYHNRRFADDRIDACYVPLLVDDVDALFELAELLPLDGFSVTIPHKRSVIAHLSSAGPDVLASDACNTVLRDRAGWSGVNTDVPGFLAPLEEVLEGPLSGRRVLVLGAGGAARGVAYALLSRGARICIWNRTASRARSLAEDLQRYAAGGTVTVVEPGDPDRPASAPDVEIVVNTTSVGMHGEGDPAPWYAFRGDEVVYDIVYTPPHTPFIRRALSSGCRVVTGDRMFEAQAAAQYELYRALATGAAPLS